MDIKKATVEQLVGEIKKKRVLCARCAKPIYMTKFGGITKEGFFHQTCIVAFFTTDKKKKLDRCDFIR